MEKYFAVAAPGVEPLTRAELVRLGLLPAASSPATLHEVGGVSFEGGREAL
jgi:hypothetical protein